MLFHYTKPILTVKKIKINFFLSNISFWDSFGNFGEVYASSHGGDYDDGRVDYSQQDNNNNSNNNVNGDVSIS